MFKCLIHLVHFFSKKLSAPGVFPLKMQDDILQWKLALYYDAENDDFILHINGKAFLSLPYKASLDPPGSQNIEQS